MPKLIVFTNEPENFVPKELKAKAEAAGYDVELVNPDECFLNVSDQPALFHNGKKFTGADACIPRLSESNLEYKTAVMGYLADSNVKMLNTAESMALASSKLQTQVLLNKSGVKTPNSAILMSADQLEAAHNSIGGKYPVILKTLSGTHGVGVMRVDSAGSMMSVAQTLEKENVQYMLQEYIEHEESRRILMLNGEVVACVSRSVPKDDFRTNAHQGAELTLVTAEANEIEVAKKVCELIGTKLGAVDYLVKGDEIIVFELNGSPGWESMQKVVPDVDIAQRVIDAFNAPDASSTAIVPITDTPIAQPEQIIDLGPVGGLDKNREQTEESVNVDEKAMTVGKAKDFNLTEGDEISYNNFTYKVSKVDDSGNLTASKVTAEGTESEEISIKANEEITFVSRPGMATGFVPNAVKEAEEKVVKSEDPKKEGEVEYETDPEDAASGQKPIDLSPVSSASVKIAGKDTDTPVVGSVQKFSIKRFNSGEPIVARVDTGATGSSINGENVKVEGNLISFTFNKVRYRCHVARVVTIKSANGNEERQIVKFDIDIDGIALNNVEFSIAERGDMKYDALLGRSALSAAGVLVNPALGELDKTDEVNESFVETAIDAVKSFMSGYKVVKSAQDAIDKVVDAAEPVEKKEESVKEEKVFDPLSNLRESESFNYQPGMEVYWSQGGGPKHKGIVESVEKDTVIISVGGISLKKSLIDRVVL